MCVLDELGVSMDKLHEYCRMEGDELARYSGHCAKRQEDLGKFNGQFGNVMIFAYFPALTCPAYHAQRRWQAGYLSSVTQYR
jgi:hypothetical protein